MKNKYNNIATDFLFQVIEKLTKIFKYLFKMIESWRRVDGASFLVFLPFEFILWEAFSTNTKRQCFYSMVLRKLGRKRSRELQSKLQLCPFLESKCPGIFFFETLSLKVFKSEKKKNNNILKITLGFTAL